MCGIAGIVDARLDRESLAAVLERMESALVHRGPDEGGQVVFGEEGVGLACRRLSLLDLEHGQQPMASADGNVHVVFNGEIYDHAEIREELRSRGHRFRSRCDTEVLVHLYEERGADLLEGLRGMFALAIYDRRTRNLLLARDGPGMKPLYLARTDRGVLFASEVRALLASGLVRAEPDPAAIDVFLALGYVPAPLSGFTGVEKVRPGEFVEIREGRQRRGRFWELQYRHDRRPRSDAEHAGELEDLLRGAVESHLEADVPVGAFLSGGLDSSLVTTLAARRLGSALKTFSIVFPEDPAADESRYSRLLAKRLGTDHHEVEYRSSQFPDLLLEATRHLGEPLSAAPFLLQYRLSGLAAGQVKAVLSGEGADELFGGYPWLGNVSWEMARRIAPRGLMRSWSERVDDPRWRKLLRVLGAADDAAADAEWFRGFTSIEKNRLLRPEYRSGGPDMEAVRLEPGVAASCRDRLQRRLALEVTRRLPDRILGPGDRMSMAHSLEVRMPFLDRGIVDFALGLPSRLKVRGGREKVVLSMLGHLLPPEIARRRKQGLMVPVWRFGREPLAGFVREYLLDGSCGGGPYDRAYVEARLDRWLRPRYGWYGRPMRLVYLKAWWEEFFGGAERLEW